MIRQLFKYKWYIIVILVLIIVEPSINSVLNFWLQNLFNSAIPGTQKIIILRLLTAGFLLWILKRVVSFCLGVIRTKFICNAKLDIKHNMFVTLMGLDTSNISEIASSGEYISLFTNDIYILETRFYNQIVSFISGVFSVIIMGSSFFALNVKLAGAILIFGLISMFVPVAFSKKLNKENLLYSNKISIFTQRIKEYMAAYPTIKNYSIEQEIIDKFDSINNETENKKFDADYSLILANNIGQLLSWFMQFIGVGLGIMMVIKGEILIGTVIAAQSFASDLASPLQDIIINVNNIRSVKEIVRKIEKLSKVQVSTDIETKNDRLENYDKKDINDHNKCELMFNDVVLKINNKVIINHFTFTFEPCKKYLVIGLNGSGKSSIFKALKKWYNNLSGEILVNGKNITEISNKEISRFVSYLNENVSLFSGSVKDNIVLFKERTYEIFEKALETAQIKLDINREINDEGRNISSGEQRRIEIARSLMEDVNVLIFDEVVSTLDIETAYEIEKQALSFEEKTVIFISHNFSGKLIRSYDEILVIDNGELLAHGKYDDLYETCEYFKKICQIKFGLYEEVSSEN